MASGTLAALGVPGELRIGGAGLARGYLGRPDLTAERFIPNPFSGDSGARLYRTGDLVRQLPDGSLDFLGRLDNQVKVRGYRIELGEIEAALSALPDVREAVVVVKSDRSDGSDRSVGSPADLRLVAYVTGEVDTAALRQALRDKLPDFMLPSAIVALSALPLTPSGKVDRKALPEPDSGPAPGFVAPRTAVEEVLAEIWAELLGIAHIGVHDNFFERGGHSLLATQVVSRVRDAFGVELPLRAFFEAPTVTALAARIDGERRGEPAQPSPIVPVPRDRGLPLSFAQQRLWFLDRLAPDNPFYNMYGAFRLTGALDLDALRGAFREIVRRHEALRTTFQPGEHGPVQVIAPAPAFDVPLVDLEGLAEDLRRRELARLSGDEARRPFNLDRGPLVRAALLRIAAREHTLLVNLHHIISDGWSMGILFHELATLYGAFCQGAPSPLPELPIQYADFSVWQREWLSGERLAAELDYWRRQLDGIPESLELPFDHPRPAIESFRGANKPFAPPVELSHALAALTRRRGATQSMTLLAGFTSLLGRLARQEDVAVGMAIANRTRREVEGLIGFFVNTLVVRTDLSGRQGFAELVGQIRETALASYAHQDLPFERLVEELQPERNLSRNPLVQVMYGFQNFPRADAKVRGLVLSPPEDTGLTARTAKFDLTLFLFEEGGLLWGSLEYNGDLFDATTIQRLLAHFERLLAAAVAQPETAVALLPLLSEGERHQLAREWNDTVTAHPAGASLQELFEEQVRNAPGAVAVIQGARSLSYAELNRRANRLAHRLRGLGVGPESRVGLCLERSPEMVVGLLGIVKAGGAYVPLDPDYPDERLALMVEVSGLRALVGEESTLARLPGRLIDGAGCILLGADLDAEPGPADDLPISAGGDSLAYVIYTSGSTGRPKGVMIHHRGWSNLADAQRRLFGLGPGDRVLQFASLSFDASAWEIAMAFSAGATLVLGPRERRLSREELTSLLRESTVATLPPAVLSTLSPEDLPGLATLIVAGEACPLELARPWAAGRRFWNAYGPTEATVCATAKLYGGEERLTIGWPIEEAQAHVLDGRGNPVPVGVAGELCLGGVGLARGYLNLPGRTAESFVPHPFATRPGERLYRTGDLVQRLPGGEIKFLGRLDHQVKIRGFRIEPGEVEARLAEHPAVLQSYVLAREDVPGDRLLVAYVVEKPVEDPAWEAPESGAQTEQVSQWREIFDDMYRDEAVDGDPTFDTTGWDSTYTGLPLPAGEMEEWLDDTIRGIAALAPRRTLEIGCGTGMILFRIAPRCEVYTGIDISGRALHSIESQLGRLGLDDGRVQLLRRSAHELDGFAADSFDTVVVNSVAQYFPSADYLAEVVACAVELVRPGGAIVLGDLRSLPLLEAFHTALELFQADPETPLARLRQRVHARHLDENELVIDPAFFTALRERLPKLGRIEIHPKRGRAHNELTGFRYQVVLRIGTGREEPVQDGVLDWRREGLTLAALRRRLAEDAPPVLRLRNIPNARTAEAAAAARLLEAPEGIETAADLRRRAAEAA
ncbi:MAG TPA: amino acid adenylation domain-containing protein, partial [Thermoanaerobaculia bacterium]